MGTIYNPRNVLCGDHVEFDYNGKVRQGTVERVGKTFMTVKHDRPELYGNKVYSTYKFLRLGSQIKVR